ncbi:MAG: sugar transferase, partial [Flavobacteriaceae bacterium]|nr:sugar transferase [Flavobacteriaceae bacterium]
VFLFYILTPFITPALPESRLQMLYFYITIILAMAIGRLLYIGLIHSPKFKKSVIVIADGNRITEIADGLTKADGNYKIKYYLSTTKSGNPKTDLKELFESNLLKVVQEEGIHEIVVTENSKFSSSELYNSLLTLFNLGYNIKDYSEVYEELTGKVFVSFTDAELYKQFPFSKYNNKPLYLVYQRVFDILISSIGLFVLMVLLPFIFVLNLKTIENLFNLFKCIYLVCRSRLNCFGSTH